MGLPLPKVVADVGPGGPLVTAMGGINALANNMHLQKINHIKSQYAPLTERANAASKLAYANLTSMQPLFNLLKNDPAFAQLSEEEKQAFIKRVQAMGMGGSTGGPLSNSFNEAINFQPQNRNPLGWVFDKFKNLIHSNPNQQQNSLAQPVPQQVPRAPSNALIAPRNQAAPESNEPTSPGIPEGWNPDLIVAQQNWEKSPEGQAEIAEKGENAMAPPDEELLAKYGPKRANVNPMELEVTQGNTAPKKKTYEENAIDFTSKLAEGPEAGKLRARVVDEIGKDQLQLSKTGASLDRLIGDFTNPDFVALRAEFPYLQDMQLEAASHLEDPRVQHMIGKIKADIESFKGQTVQSFGGQTLKREFDYADQLKPNTNDTVYTALGKASALKSLKEVASKKNNLIKDLMQKKHMSLADAVEIADKKIDIKGIEKKVDELTAPTFPIKNKKTGITLFITKSRAKELGYKLKSDKSGQGYG